MAENREQILSQERFSKPKTSDFRFRTFLEAGRAFVTRPPEIIGWENFYAIPKGINPVIAPTHLTDADVTIAASAFSRVADIGLASLKTNQTDVLVGKLVALAGRGNFFDVANTFEEGRPHFSLNAGDFLRMAQQMKDHHKSMVIASQGPIYGERILPESSGLAAVIVANLADRVVLPVAVEFKTDERVAMAGDIASTIRRLISGNRPDASVHIAEPLYLDELPEAIKTSRDEVLRAINLLNRGTRKLMTNDEKGAAVSTLRKLQKQGDAVVGAQASELPVESRGIWDKKLKDGF